MNSDDRKELKDLLTAIVSPVETAAKDAANHAMGAKAEVAALRVELNGAEGRPGIKERLVRAETMLTTMHSPDSTQQRQALSVLTDEIREQLRQDAKKRSLITSMPPPAIGSGTTLKVARWKAIAALAALGAALVGATYGVTTATQPAAASPAPAAQAP